MKYPFLKNIVFLLLMPLSVKAQNEISTSLFTGKLNYTIPVYTIEDPDLHLDIVLRYNSDGFKPFQPSGCYGQNWTLIAGGYITREVQDIADEHKMIYDDCCDREIGMLRAIKEGKMPDKDEVCDFCDYDSVMLADGLLQVSTLEKQIDLDYEGTMTDQAAVARWGVSVAEGLVVVGMISAVILRSLRRRKGTGEKQVFFCPSCGTLLKADSTVCKKCGSQITH